MSESSLQLEIAQLVSQMCESALAEEHVLRLNELLIDNPVAQQFYLRQLEIDAALAWRTEPIELPGDIEDVTPPARMLIGMPARGAWSLRTAASILLVAGLFYGGFAVLAWNMQPAAHREFAAAPSVDAPPPPPAVSKIATVSGSEGAVWRNMVAGRTAGLGDSLSADFRGELVAGAIEFTLTSGTIVEVVSPSTIELRSAEAVHLDRGKLTAKVPPQAIGFTVTTPTVTIVDLGTEFGVEADERGATEVHVLRGIVETQLRGSSGPARRLVAREAMRFDAVSEMGTPIEAAFARFTRTISGKHAPSASRDVQVFALGEILPGSEHATLVANGDFSDLGELEGSAYPRPEIWERDLHMFAGQPAGVRLPPLCNGAVAYANIDANVPAAVYSQSVRLQPNTEYVLSAYLWNLGDWEHRLQVNVDLDDAVGEANLILSPSPEAAHGAFAYQTFSTGETGESLRLRLFYDNPQAADSNWPQFPTGAMWDRVAITKASRFVPPVLRRPEHVRLPSQSTRE